MVAVYYVQRIAQKTYAGPQSHANVAGLASHKKNKIK